MGVSLHLMVKCRRAWLVGHTAKVYLVLSEIAQLSSKEAESFWNSHQKWMRPPIAPYSHQHLVCVLGFCHSKTCIVVSHCFNLQFPNYAWFWVSFHMLICHLSSLVKHLFRHFAHLSNGDNYSLNQHLMPQSRHRQRQVCWCPGQQGLTTIRWWGIKYNKIELIK